MLFNTIMSSFGMVPHEHFVYTVHNVVNILYIQYIVCSEHFVYTVHVVVYVCSRIMVAPFYNGNSCVSHTHVQLTLMG